MNILFISILFLFLQDSAGIHGILGIVTVILGLIQVSCLTSSTIPTNEDNLKNCQSGDFIRVVSNPLNNQ